MEDYKKQINQKRLEYLPVVVNIYFREKLLESMTQIGNSCLNNDKNEPISVKSRVEITIFGHDRQVTDVMVM